jgi:hypothetical protein
MWIKVYECNTSLSRPSTSGNSFKKRKFLMQGSFRTSWQRWILCCQKVTFSRKKFAHKSPVHIYIYLFMLTTYVFAALMPSDLMVCPTLLLPLHTVTCNRGKANQQCWDNILLLDRKHGMCITHLTKLDIFSQMPRLSWRCAYEYFLAFFIAVVVLF